MLFAYCNFIFVILHLQSRHFTIHWDDVSLAETKRKQKVLFKNAYIILVRLCSNHR